MEKTLGLDSTDIALLQLLATALGGVFALYLFWISIKEKRNSFTLVVFDRLYGDDDIVNVLYAADKETGLEKLREKIELKDKTEAKLEKEVDKTIRYFDFIGGLLKSKQLRTEDLMPFQYELSIVLNDPTIIAYIAHLKAIPVNLSNLDYLTQELKRKNYLANK